MEEELLVETEDYDFLLAEVKTASLLEEWIQETREDDVTKKFRIGPGDIRRMVSMAEWLIYAAHELARLFAKTRMKTLARLMPRIRYGVKEELLPLVDLRGVGRVRARALFERGHRKPEDLRRIGVDQLARIPTIGPAIARSILSQLGRREEPEEAEEERSDGQYALYDFE